MKPEKKTEWKLRKDGTYIRATYGFEYLQGNRRPHFHITADIAEEQNRNNRHEELAYCGPANKKFRITGGGCCHEDIAKAFPKLAELIPWHLADDTGAPMHYAENARYWLQKHFGVFRLWKEKPGALARATAGAREMPEPRKVNSWDPDPLDAFMSTVNYGILPSDIKMFPLTDDMDAEATLAKLPAWLEYRLPFLREAMRQTMERHGIEYIPESAYAVTQG